MCKDKVTIKHDIDASRQLSQQLFNDTELDTNNHYFDHIRFNFPHLGIEDAISHRSLLGHFLHSTKSVMHKHSIVYITITQQQ